MFGISSAHLGLLTFYYQEFFVIWGGPEVMVVQKLLKIKVPWEHDTA